MRYCATYTRLVFVAVLLCTATFVAPPQHVSACSLAKSYLETQAATPFDVKVRQRFNEADVVFRGRAVAPYNANGYDNSFFFVDAAWKGIDKPSMVIRRPSSSPCPYIDYNSDVLIYAQWLPKVDAFAITFIGRCADRFFNNLCKDELQVLGSATRVFLPASPPSPHDPASVNY